MLCPRYKCKSKIIKKNSKNTEELFRDEADSTSNIDENDEYIIEFLAPECEEAEQPIFESIEELLIQENNKNDYMNKQLKRMQDLPESNLDDIMANIDNIKPRHEQQGEMFNRLNNRINELNNEEHKLTAQESQTSTDD